MQLLREAEKEDGNFCQFTGWRSDPWAALKLTHGYERDTHTFLFLQLHSVVLGLPGGSISAAGFYNAGPRKGRRTIAEMTFSVASKVCFEELHFHWNTVRLSAKPVVWDADATESDGWWHTGSAARDIPLHERSQHTHVPRGRHCRFRGFGAAFLSLTFWKRQNQGKLTFRHVPRLLPADFLACAQPQQQPEFAPPTPIFPWINNLAYIKINLFWV